MSRGHGPEETHGGHRHGHDAPGVQERSAKHEHGAHAAQHDRQGLGHRAHDSAQGAGAGPNPVAEHRARGRAARCLVITVSDTRTIENDTSGRRATELLEAAGHEVREREIVHDDRAVIAALVRAGVANPEIDAVILTGGTGIGPRDVTCEALEDMLEKPLDGFGELFRKLSFDQLGPAAMLSRAIGGVVGQTVVFALPGATRAVELGIEKLIGPELGHIVGLLAP